LKKTNSNNIKIEELIKNNFDFSKIKIGLVISVFNEEISQNLQSEVLKELKKHDIKIKDQNYFVEIYVPGVFELSQSAYHLAKTSKYDAIICLGAVIKGETKHDQYISMSAGYGITQASILTDTPIIFGVLTTENIQQAKERISNGSYYAKSALEMAIRNSC
jgi:6,7-dimethyl-8-ribityllumazine synthase